MLRIFTSSSALKSGARLSNCSHYNKIWLKLFHKHACFSMFTTEKLEFLRAIRDENRFQMQENYSKLV